MRPRSFISGNTYIRFSLQCVPNPVPVPSVLFLILPSKFRYFSRFFISISLSSLSNPLSLCTVPNPVSLHTSSSIHILILSLFAQCSLFQILFLYIHLPHFSFSSSLYLSCVPYSRSYSWYPSSFFPFLHYLSLFAFCFVFHLPDSVPSIYLPLFFSPSFLSAFSPCSTFQLMYLSNSISLCVQSLFHIPAHVSFHLYLPLRSVLVPCSSSCFFSSISICPVSLSCHPSFSSVFFSTPIFYLLSTIFSSCLSMAGITTWYSYLQVWWPGCLNRNLSQPRRRTKTRPQTRHPKLERRPEPPRRPAMRLASKARWQPSRKSRTVAQHQLKPRQVQKNRQRPKRRFSKLQSVLPSRKRYFAFARSRGRRKKRARRRHRWNAPCSVIRTSSRPGRWMFALRRPSSTA